MQCPSCGLSFENGTRCPICGAPLTSAGDEYLGLRVEGYELVECVAASARARVYRGVGEGGCVAIKVYDSHRFARFTRELSVLCEIVHPHVARLLGWGRLESGATYLASEWVQGQTLEHILARGPLAWTEALRLARAIGVGLAAIHAAGVVHRDLKPSNLALPDSGSPPVKILDFGHSMAPWAERLTRSGAAVGTAAYMAPEQAVGAKIDLRADLYALGVILYRTLTGVLPFTHESTFELARMHVESPVVPPRARGADIPRAVDDLCMWLLAKVPDCRLPNTHVLLLTLQSLNPGFVQEPAFEEVP